MNVVLLWGLHQRICVEADRITPGKSRALSLVSPPQDRTCWPWADSGRSGSEGPHQGGPRDTHSLRATAIAHTLDLRALCLHSSLPASDVKNKREKDK